MMDEYETLVRMRDEKMWTGWDEIYIVVSSSVELRPSAPLHSRI